MQANGHSFTYFVVMSTTEERGRKHATKSTTSSNHPQILLATILLITRRLKTKDVPQIADVIALVQTHYTYETILSRGKPLHSRLHELWLPWEHWYVKRYI